MSSRHHRSFAWRVGKAIEHAGDRRPLMSRTGPPVVLGFIGVIAEIFAAPLVLSVTVVVGLLSYAMLDTPISKLRSQGRPRFVSVRLLYLNTVIVAGLWLAVMFTFSAADPAMSTIVDQRLPSLLQVASTNDLRSLVKMQKSMTAGRAAKNTVGAESTWFDVFMHGVVCSLSLNFLLYGVVIARRRQRSLRREQKAHRRSLRYDSNFGLFVDEDAPVP